jgi:hypothetical protein
MKQFLQAAALLFITITSVGSGMAQAADSWLPQFQTGQHVYIAPALPDNVRTDFSASDFQAKLTAAARKQNFDVYLIVTRSPADASAAGGYGRVLVNKLWKNWKTNSSFASGRALVILMTGGRDNKLVSVGVRVGENFDYWLDGPLEITSWPNGPVMPIVRTYLSSNPSAVPLKLVDTIGHIIREQIIIFTLLPLIPFFLAVCIFGLLWLSASSKPLSDSCGYSSYEFDGKPKHHRSRRHRSYDDIFFPF